MPEDLEDKLMDFGLMLAGFCLDENDRYTMQEKKRLECYFFDLRQDIIATLNAAKQPQKA